MISGDALPPRLHKTESGDGRSISVLRASIGSGTFQAMLVGDLRDRMAPDSILMKPRRKASPLIILLKNSFPELPYLDVVQ